MGLTPEQDQFYLNLINLSKELRVNHDDPTNSAVKPAWKSTEFWLTAVTMVVGLLLSSGVLSPEDPGQAKLLQLLGLASTLLSSLGYTAARTSAKNKAVEGAAAVAIAKVSIPTEPS